MSDTVGQDDLPAATEVKSDVNLKSEAGDSSKQHCSLPPKNDSESAVDGSGDHLPATVTVSITPDKITVNPELSTSPIPEPSSSPLNTNTNLSIKLCDEIDHSDEKDDNTGATGNTTPNTSSIENITLDKETESAKTHEVDSTLIGETEMTVSGEVKMSVSSEVENTGSGKVEMTVTDKKMTETGDVDTTETDVTVTLTCEKEIATADSVKLTDTDETATTETGDAAKLETSKIEIAKADEVKTTNSNDIEMSDIAEIDKPTSGEIDITKKNTEVKITKSDVLSTNKAGRVEMAKIGELETTESGEKEIAKTDEVKTAKSNETVPSEVDMTEIIEDDVKVNPIKVGLKECSIDATNNAGSKTPTENEECDISDITHDTNKEIAKDTCSLDDVDSSENQDEMILKWDDDDDVMEADTFDDKEEGKELNLDEPTEKEEVTQEISQKTEGGVSKDICEVTQNDELQEISANSSVDKELTKSEDINEDAAISASNMDVLEDEMKTTLVTDILNEIDEQIAELGNLAKDKEQSLDKTDDTSPKTTTEPSNNKSEPLQDKSPCELENTLQKSGKTECKVEENSNKMDIDENIENSNEIDDKCHKSDTNDDISVTATPTDEKLKTSDINETVNAKVKSNVVSEPISAKSESRDVKIEPRSAENSSKPTYDDGTIEDLNIDKVTEELPANDNPESGKENKEKSSNSLDIKEDSVKKEETDVTKQEIEASDTKDNIQLSPATVKEESDDKLPKDVESVAKDTEDVKSSNSLDIKEDSIKEVTDVTKQEIEASDTKDNIQLSPANVKEESDDKLSKDVESVAKDTEDVHRQAFEDVASTSQMAPDSANDAGEMADSLGLLAESSRVRDDDDEQEELEQETSEQDDDDDQDFDPDDESNQMTAENSEDSTQTETDTKCQLSQADNVEYEKDLISVDKEFGFSISEVVGDVKIDDDQMDIDEDMVSEEVEMVSEVDVEVNEEQINEVEPSTAADDVTEKDVQVDKTSVDTTTDKPEASKEEHTDEKATSNTTQELAKDVPEEKEKDEPSKQSPSKTKKLEISKPKHVVNIVDLEESSSEDDIQEVIKTDTTDKLSVNISKAIEVMSSGESMSDMTSSQGDTVVSVPKPTAPRVARINTSEVSIKTTTVTEPTLVIPERKMSESQEDSSKPKFGLEVFSLDSDDDESTVSAGSSAVLEKDKISNKCINSCCTSDVSVAYYTADPSTVAYYEGNKKKKAMVCQHCAEVVALRAQKLVEGIKNFTPLLELDMRKSTQELVEISDSDSEEEEDNCDDGQEKIGEERAGVLERELADMINATWLKFKLDARLKKTQDELQIDLDKLELESAEVNAMLDECQVTTDRLRAELYDTFKVEKKELQALTIYDTPDHKFSCLEQTRDLKRKLSSATESQAKKPAIPLPYPQQNTKPNTSILMNKLQEPLVHTISDASKIDDDKDVSVVKLSAESAPADLPPPGEVVKEPLQVGMAVYAMRNTFGSWVRAKIIEFMPKANNNSTTMCRVRFESKNNRQTYKFKVLPARSLAYPDPPKVRMTIGTRIIALFKDSGTAKTRREVFSSGVVAEIANPVNKYRYLVFFDDGYAQYVRHSDLRLVCESSALVWEEVHPFSREFVKKYLLAYPERPMVRMRTGQNIKTEWNGKWWVTRVLQVDASLVEVYFEQDRRTEWIYRGSTRLAPLYLELQAAEQQRLRPLPRNRMHARVNMPYVEYTRSDEQDIARTEAHIKAQQEELRRQRAVAKKSTTSTPPSSVSASGNLDNVTSRVVYYTPKSAVKPHKMAPHACSPACKRTDVLALKDLRTYNPLAKPLLSGWERQIVRYKGHKEIVYRAACGRRVRNMAELHRYLRAVQSDMSVDLFDFGPNTHCLAEFVLNRCIVGKKDLSHGKENVPVPCVNYYDDSLPEFCSYNTERTPTAGVPLNLDPEFLCGCDCTDDCQDKSKCACWKMTLEGARTIGLSGNVGYVYKRLPEPLPSGIYECNSRCKCKITCLNRVAQHPLQLKLQVFKTVNRGWGIRALNDVPKGSFLCIYAGNLLTDATANLDGLNEGDEYLAELDYIEVVEQMKEGYEDDIPEQDKKLDKKESSMKSESESEETESEEETTRSKTEEQDGDFQPGFIGMGVAEFSKRLRKRHKKEKTEKTEEQPQKKEKESKENGDEDCITISDDEELREPSRFAAQAGMGAKYVPKYKSVRTLFGEDEACYIMDAKVQGNIGRYLNHSCSPNVFVQNVFVDTHDPRFPWVAFFALNHIRAGTELTWNYNYDVGSVPGKALYCYCGAPNCRGRLL